MYECVLELAWDIWQLDGQ